MRKCAVLLLVLIYLTAACVVATNLASCSNYVAENSWTQRAPLPQGKYGVGVAVVEGKIYAIGGSAFVPRNTSEMYDPTNDTWVAKAQMPTLRSNFGIAAVLNKIYVIGGANPLTDVNEVYDSATDTWETKTSMPTRLYGMDANVVDGKIYVIGGKNSSGWVDGVNEVYDSATDAWTTKAPMPTPVSFYVSAVVDKKIYVIGGYNGSAIYLTQIYDPKTDTWSSGAPVPSDVRCAGAGATTGVWAPKRIYVVGAGPYTLYTKTSVINTPYFVKKVQTIVYDPEKDVWSNGAAMPEARILPGVAVADDVLYAIGGSTCLSLPFIGYSKENQQYTPVGYRSVSPVVSLVSPENTNYTSSNVSLAFAVNKPTVWMSYSIDGQDNVTLTGNITLTGLTNGLHNVTVYAEDKFGNIGTSETINFSIEVPEAFPTVWLVAAASGAFVAFVSLVVFFKKQRRSAVNSYVVDE